MLLLLCHCYDVGLCYGISLWYGVILCYGVSLSYGVCQCSYDIRLCYGVSLCKGVIDVTATLGSTQVGTRRVPLTSGCIHMSFTFM